MSRIRLTEMAAAGLATPPADTAEIFFDDATNPGVLKIKKDDGTVVTIESTAGADADAIHDNVAGEIVLIAEKATPIAADLLIIEDSAAGNVKKRVQIGNLPAAAEVNDLDTDGVLGIADDQLVVGTGAGTAAYKTLPDGAVAYDTATNAFAQASSADLSDGPFLTTVALDDLSDVTLTAPATGAVLVKSAGDWVDGQVDLADADAVTGDLPFANFTPATAESKLLGRGQGLGAGDYEEITIGAGLTMTGTTITASAAAPALTDLTDVTLTAPATGSVLIKSAGDWIDGQVDLADGDAVTGVLAKANMAATTVHTDQANTYSTGAQDFSAATTVVFTDNTISIKDNIAPTKVMQIDCSNITAGTTRVYTTPDTSTQLAGATGVLTFSNKTLDNSNVITIHDANFTLQDEITPTKQAKFQAVNISPATTRTYVLPDADGTIALTGSLNAVTVTVADEATDATCFPVFVTDATGDLGPKSNAALTFNSATATLAATNINATTFTGALTGNADTATTAGACTGNSATVTVADAAGDTTTWVLLGTGQTGSLAPATDASLTYNATDNSLTTTTFIGALTGNADTATSAGACTGNSATVTVANEAADTTCFPLFAVDATGSLEPKTNANYKYNSNTGLLEVPSVTVSTTLTVPVAAGAAPTVSGQVAYDSTANQLEYGDNGTNRIVVNTDEAQTLTNKTINDPSNFVDADQLHYRVWNDTGSPLAKGAAVYISGYSIPNALATVALADCDAGATMPALGLVEDTIANGAAGQVLIGGVLKGTGGSPLDTSGFSVANPLYVSGTAGVLTATEPVGSALIQKVGICVRAHVTLGEIAIVGAGRSNAIPNFTAAENLFYGGTAGVKSEFTMAAGIRTFMTTPTSANLISAVTDETGSGALVFGTAPTIAGSTLTGVHDGGGATSFEIPNGAGGTTVDVAGEICVDTTSRTINFHDGTAEVVLNPVQSKSISIEDPTAAEDITLFYTNSAITITQIRAVCIGTTPSVTWTIRHSNTDRSAAGTEAVTGGTTTTSITTGSDVTVFNDATATAGWVWLETTAESGTTDELHITIYFRQDP